jgi:hypothetical protein
VHHTEGAASRSLYPRARWGNSRVGVAARSDGTFLTPAAPLRTQACFGNGLRSCARVAAAAAPLAELLELLLSLSSGSSAASSGGSATSAPVERAGKGAGAAAKKRAVEDCGTGLGASGGGDSAFVTPWHMRQTSFHVWARLRKMA